MHYLYLQGEISNLKVGEEKMLYDVLCEHLFSGINFVLELSRYNSIIVWASHSRSVRTIRKLLSVGVPFIGQKKSR